MAKNDLHSLKDYRSNIAANLAETFKISLDDAESIIARLESEGILKIEAPRFVEQPAEVLINDWHASRNELGMTSHKIGNVKINFKKDWRDGIAFVNSLVETAAGLGAKQPYLITIGIVQCVISASKLTDIKISPNGTAIIMALQKHKEHMMFAVHEKQCMEEANEILKLNGYKPMNNDTFGVEIAELITYKCIDEENQIVKLLESVLFPY